MRKSNQTYTPIMTRVNQLKNAILTETEKTLPVIQKHAIMNFWQAEKALPKTGLIGEVFKSFELSQIELLERKFLESGSSIIAFMRKLTEKERGILINWIMENYTPIDFHIIRENY